MLQKTADSILSQRYVAWQWIVVDGASSDGTHAWMLDLAATRASIEYISEPDRGIYDAWNKALPLIKGQWVLFLGAGDQLKNDTILQRCTDLLKSVSPLQNLAYGRVELIDSLEDTCGDLCDQGWEGLVGRWGHGRPSTPNHQGMFHRASMFRDGKKFDTSYRIAGDTAFVLPELLERGGTVLDITVALMLKGGVSGKVEARLQMLREVFRINQHAGLGWSRIHYQYSAFCYQFLKAIGILGMRRLQRRLHLPTRLR